MVLSLTPVPDLGELPEHSDKFEHFLAYGLLAAGAVQLYPRWRSLMVVGLALALDRTVLLGVPYMAQVLKLELISSVAARSGHMELFQFYRLRMPVQW